LLNPLPQRLGWVLPDLAQLFRVLQAFEQCRAARILHLLDEEESLEEPRVARGIEGASSRESIQSCAQHRIGFTTESEDCVVIISST